MVSYMNVQFLINYGQIDFFTFIIRNLAPMLSSCVTFGKGHYHLIIFPSENTVDFVICLLCWLVVDIMCINGGLSGQQTVDMSKQEIKSLTQRPINRAFNKKR